MPRDRVEQQLDDIQFRMEANGKHWNEQFKEMSTALSLLQLEQNQKHLENIERFSALNAKAAALEAVAGTIKSAVRHLDECLDGLKVKLFGEHDDGSEGVIPQMGARISSTEKFMWRMLGAGAMLAFVANVVLLIMQRLK